jgi:O-antigen ligase
MICFAPIVVYYIRDKYGKTAGLFAFLSISIIGLTLGSRSSSILVFLGCFLTYFLAGFISYRRTVIIGFLGLVFFLLISSNAGKKFISDLNPRTGELIYDFKTTMETDRSYLVRRAMIEKGMNLFHQKPITGIGLNSFNYTRGDFKGDFKGSEFVIHKDIKQGTSSHNSYITILSEGGLALSIPFALILVMLFVHFFRRLRAMPDFHRPVFLGVLMMSVHLFFITAIVNVFGWYLLALAAALMYNKDSNAAEVTKA